MFTGANKQGVDDTLVEMPLWHLTNDNKPR